MKKFTLILKIISLIIFTIIIIFLSLYVYAFITPKFQIKESNNITYYDKNGNNIFVNFNNYSRLEEIDDNINI